MAFVAGDYVSLPNNAGIVIGKLFSGSGRNQRIETLSEQDGSGIAGSQGIVLLSNFWGGYVACIEATDGSNVTVLRDPSGTLPCYYLHTPDASIITSDIETLDACGLFKPEVDWDGIARHLFALDLRSPRTGLVGFSELLAGFRLRIDGSVHATEQVWSPWDFTERDRHVDDADTVRQVRQVVEGCVSAWAGCYKRIIVSVSGGLDSSVVAASLRDQTEKLTLLTVATNEPEGDERRYARILADHLNMPLLEAHHRSDLTDVFRSTSAHLARPTLLAVAQSEITTRLQISRQRQIDAIFTGSGGDNVFCNMASATPILDRLKSDGLTFGVWQTIDDICHLTGCSVGEAIRMAIRRACRGGARYDWRGSPHLLNPRILEESALALDHSWLEAPETALPGKAAHVAMILRIQGSIDGISRFGPVQVNPLLSQPIVEACLKIPTWKWCAEGKNRAIVRNGFADALPPALVHRYSKGGPDSFAYSLIEANRLDLREHLLGGLLAEHDIVDVTALEQALSLHNPIKSADYIVLSVLAEAEAWVRLRADQQATRKVRSFSTPAAGDSIASKV